MEETAVAEAFNEYFITKVNNLKDGIDPSQKRDPFEKLAEKMKNNKSKFVLKNFSQNKLLKIMKKLKKKAPNVSR